MHETRKRNIIIVSLCGVLLLMAIGYAAFNSVLNIEGTANITSNWNILITGIEEKNKMGSAESVADYPQYENLTATFNANLVSPGDSIEYDITIENKGNLTAELESINVTDSENPAIKFSTSGLEEGSKLNAGSSHILTVKVEYNSEVTIQPEDTSATFKVTLNYVQEGHPSVYTLTYEKGDNVISIGEDSKKCPIEQEEGCQIELPSIEVENSNNYKGIWQNEEGDPVGNPGDLYTITKDETLTAIRINMQASEILKKKITTEGDGLYEDTYESGRYIFKGGNPDNYITFNNEEWRIVSIELDNSIKIMKSTSIGTMPFDKGGSRKTGYCENSGTNGCNVWASANNYDNFYGIYSYGISGNVASDSSLKQYLNSTYYNTIIKNKTAIQNHAFYYGPVIWANDDLSKQIKDEQKYSANSNIGLIQMSDYIRSNTDMNSCGNYGTIFSKRSQCSKTNWIDISVDTGYDGWTLNPNCGKYTDKVTSARHVSTFYGKSGDLGAFAEETQTAVVPAIYLKSDVQLLGSGTKIKPYTINNY